MSRRAQHVYKDSVGGSYADDVDSADTTLQGTPRSGSGEWDVKATDVETNAFAGLRSSGVKVSGGGNDGFNEHNDNDIDEENARIFSESSSRGIDGARQRHGEETASEAKAKPVSWAQLPRKDQLLILVIARLSEPLAQTSIQSYMFYQLKSFTLPSGEAPSDGTVARQAGLITAAFTGAQFCTSILWGRLADSEFMGRKRVLLIGLVGTAMMSVGFGFSQSFAVVMLWRCLGGLLNGNVGVMKTMVSEVVREKRFQSHAFLLLPMCFNVGVIIGPLLSGLLADPVGQYPKVFGPGGSIGGEGGIVWMMKYPYALPNVINAALLLLSAIVVVFGLEETLEGLRHKQDIGIRLRKLVLNKLLRRGSGPAYTAVPGQDDFTANGDIELDTGGSRSEEKEPRKIKRKLPFRRIWTRNVLLVLVSHGLMACHISMFTSLWFVFLSTPRYDPSYVPGSDKVAPGPADPSHPEPLQHVPADYTPHPPFTFTGGLALPPASIGSSLATLGTIGILLQLLLYPRLSFRLGPLHCLRIFTCLFPVAYILVPFLAILPSSSAPPAPASGAVLWLGIAVVLSVLVLARTFVLPSSSILVNNASPHPSVLGTVHGIVQSVGSGTKTVGPAVGGWIYSVGLDTGVIGLAWWFIAGVGLMGAVAAQFVWEGDGHEIWLEGEREELERERQEEGHSIPHDHRP